MMQFILSIALTFSFLAPFYAFAESSQFNVRFTVSENDIDNPTTPTDFTATASSISSVSLSWASSTDNSGVSYYRVYRDTTLVATTTALSYLDTGLNESTTYSYQVSAVDTAENESALTTAIDVTTETRPVERDTTTALGVVLDFFLGSFKPQPAPSLTIGTSSVSITWAAPQYRSAMLSYGETQDYELGTVVGSYYSRLRTTEIDGLQAGRSYYYKIEYLDQEGHATRLYQGSFVTTQVEIKQDDLVYFARDISMRTEGDSLIFSWKYPAGFKGVARIVGKSKPSVHAEDGYPVYTGEGNTAYTRVPAEDTFFTFFLKTEDGRYGQGISVKYVILEPRIITNTQSVDGASGEAISSTGQLVSDAQKHSDSPKLSILATTSYKQSENNFAIPVSVSLWLLLLLIVAILLYVWLRR